MLYPLSYGGGTCVIPCGKPARARLTLAGLGGLESTGFSGGPVSRVARLRAPFWTARARRGAPWAGLVAGGSAPWVGGVAGWCGLSVQGAVPGLSGPGVLGERGHEDDDCLVSLESSRWARAATSAHVCWAPERR